MRGLNHRLAALVALTCAALLITAVSAIASVPVAHSSATCSDYSNQADAQRAADTRDADGDGIYCESLPCPCLKPSSGGGGGGEPAPRPKPKPRMRAQVISARITSVVDGDTVKVRASGAKRDFYTVRLIGIDTPETKRPGVAVECGGKRASSSMYALAFTDPADTDGDGLFDADGGSEGRRVTLRTDSSQDTFDRYGRLLAYVTTVAGKNLATQQLSAGWAKVYVFARPFAQAARFRAAERRAKVGRRGVWRLCGGNFHRPATDTSASASRYRGYIDALNGRPVREGSQGAGWRAIFRERAPGRVRYTVCLRNLDNDVGNCWRARTDRRGSSRVFVALFVNDRGGPGAWQARWKLGGRVVASWRFRVRPEFG